MNRFLFLLGVGIGIGILVAPDKGSVTRKKIADFIDDLTDQIKNITHEAEDKVDEAIQKLPDEV